MATCCFKPNEKPRVHCIPYSRSRFYPFYPFFVKSTRKVGRGPRGKHRGNVFPRTQAAVFPLFCFSSIFFDLSLLRFFHEAKRESNPDHEYVRFFPESFLLAYLIFSFSLTFSVVSVRRISFAPSLVNYKIRLSCRFHHHIRSNEP